MRASAIVENLGIPTVSLICEGFIGQAAAISPGLGIAGLPVAHIVGHVDGQNQDELKHNIRTVTSKAVIEGLTKPLKSNSDSSEHNNDTIVAKGSFDEINELFYEQKWGDGLPIVPPTTERVAAFLTNSDEDPDRVIGILKPSGSAATIRNIAINGVMANCLPEYMPVLIAITEVLVDPAYGVEHSGDTTGGEALIILNGPIARQLKFNCEEAALRDGYQANTSVGRFLRLFLRNVAGFLPGGTDKSTFGHTWRVVLAENEAAAQNVGWSPFSIDAGFEPGANIVTIGRFTSSGVIGSIYGNDPNQIAHYLADGLVRQSSWEFSFTVGFAPGTYRPLVVLSPMVAKTLSQSGITKQKLRSLLFQHARLPASKMESYIGAWSNLVPGKQTLSQMVEAGTAAACFAENDDPERMVPIVEKPEHILLVLSGDSLRSNAIVFGSNGMHGFPTSRRIRLPEGVSD
jgi:hypothetical protein